MVTAPPPAAVMIQQQPATLIMAPTPPPNVVQMAPAANLFTGAQPAPVAAYQPPPVAAYQPPPVAAFVPVAPAPAPVAAYQPAAPTGMMGSAVILRGPGVIRGTLAAFGRALSDLGNPTVQMNTTASFATAQIPVNPAPAQYQAPPTAQYQAPPPPPPAPCPHGPYPSAQSAPCSSRFCRLLHNHSTN
jgi:hypothetical protein